MKGLLIVLVLLVAGIVGLGFYQGWFNLSSKNADHESNMTITVDKDKFQEDKEKAEKKMHDLGPKAKEKTDRTDKKDLER